MKILNFCSSLKHFLFFSLNFLDYLDRRVYRLASNFGIPLGKPIRFSVQEGNLKRFSLIYTKGHFSLNILNFIRIVYADNRKNDEIFVKKENFIFVLSKDVLGEKITKINVD
jgi:hypothetical protein